MIQNKTLVHCIFLIHQHSLLKYTKKIILNLHPYYIHTFTPHSFHTTFAKAINLFDFHQINIITLNQNELHDMPFHEKHSNSQHLTQPNDLNAATIKCSHTLINFTKSTHKQSFKKKNSNIFQRFHTFTHTTFHCSC